MTFDLEGTVKASVQILQNYIIFRELLLLDLIAKMVKILKVLKSKFSRKSKIPLGLNSVGDD